VAGEPTINPYAPPASDTEGAAPPVAGGAFGRPLYSPRQIGWAAFFGSPLAGVVLLQANFRAMARSRQANTTLLFGTLASGVLLALLILMPRSIPTLPFNLAAAYAMLAIANATQGAAFTGHRAAGGARRSHWWVVFAIFATVAALFAALAVIFFGLDIRPGGGAAG